MRRLVAFFFYLLSLVLPLVVAADAIDYTDWRKSDGTPQSVMLSYYDGPDTRGFAWQTSTSVSSGALWLLKGEWDSSTGNFDTNQVATATRASGDSCYCYKAYVTGLSAGTWSYRLGTTSHYAYGKFEVRDRAKPFVAVNITDIQMKYAEDLNMWKNVVKASDTILGSGPNTDTILYCGDFFDRNKNPSEAASDYVRWGVVADQARPEFADVAWTMVSGNHDPTYFDTCICEHFQYTDNDNYGCHSYDYGNVHVATLPHTNGDSNEENAAFKSKVKEWLQNDLAAAQGATWRILVVHMGPYTTGDHGYAVKSDYIQEFAGICATYKVDLVLQGHDHTYSKTLPYLWSGKGSTSSNSDSAVVNLNPATIVIGGETYYDNPEGTVYVSAGCAGDRVGENDTYASSTYKNRSNKIVTDTVKVNSNYASIGADGSKDVGKPMFAILTIDGETLKYDWYVAASATPELFDTLRIAKSGSEPVDPEPEAEELGLAVNGSFARLLSSDEPVTWSVACEPSDIVSATLGATTGEETVLRLTGLAEGTATVTVSRLGADGEPVVVLQYAVTVAGEEVEPDDPTPPPPVEPAGTPGKIVTVSLDVNATWSDSVKDSNTDVIWLLGSTEASKVSAAINLETTDESRFAGYAVRTTEAAQKATVTLTGLQPGTARVYLGRYEKGYEDYREIFARYDVTVVGEGGEDPVVPTDLDETVTLAPGGTTNLTTVTSAGAWNVLSDSSCVTAIAATNRDGTCTVAISCAAVCERDVTVEIRRGSETPGAGRLVKTVTVRTAAADESFVLAIGETATVSASHPNGRFWSVSESSTCAAALSSPDRVKDIVLTLTATNGGEEVITLYQKTEPAADPVAVRIVHVRVKPAATVVTPPTVSGSFTYGQVLSDLELTGGDAEVEGAFSWTVPSAYPPAGGSVPVEVTFTPTGEAAELYSPVTFTITLSVAKRVLTVTPVDVAIITGEAIPDDAYELSGLAAGDRADTIGISGAPTYASEYDPENPVEGEYAFTVADVSQMSSANYTFVASGDTATLTVKPDNILEDQDPDNDGVIELELHQGESVTFVTRQTNEKWYSTSSDTATATVSGVRDEEKGSYALTITGVYADSSTATVTVRYGTTSSTGGTKLKEIKVTVLPAEETIRLHVGEKTTRTVEFSSSRYWLAGGSGANGTFEYASAAFAASAKETSSYSGYSIRTTSTAKKADMIFEALSVGTETITVARQNNTSSPTPMYVYTVVVERGLEPFIAPAVTIPYGTRLGDAEVDVDGTMVDPDGNPVGGTFVFDNPDERPGVQKSGAFPAQFIPSDDAWRPIAVTVDVTVTKATLTVRAKAGTIAWGDPSAAACAYELSGFVADDTAQTVAVTGEPTYVNGYEEGVERGEYALSVTDVAKMSSANYTFVADATPAVVTVGRRAVMVTADPASKTYGDEDPDEFTATVSGTLNGDTVSYTLSRVEGEDAKIYAITPTGAVEQGNYAVKFVAGTFTINPRPITSVTAAPQAYTGSLIDPVLTVKADDYDVTTYTVGSWTTSSGTARRSVGKHTATVEGTGNFMDSLTVTFEIVKATYDMSGVRMENVTVTYDGAAHSIVVEGLPKNVSVKDWTNNGRTDAGTYQVTATFTTSDSSHYEIPEPMTATLVIEPAPITSAVAEPQVWDGTKKTPNVVVKAGTLSATATAGEWSGSLTDIGRYTTTVTGYGNFTGELPVTFDIVRPRETPQPGGPFTTTITNGWRLVDAVVEGRMLQGGETVRGWFDFGNLAETKPSASGSFAALFRPLDTDRYSEVAVQVAVTVEADASRIVVNGVRYIDVDQPLGRIWANGGTAEFLKDVDYDNCTFAAGATAKVARDGVLVFAGAITMRAVTAGRGVVAETLTLAGDVPADGTFVSAKTLMLGAEVTVGGVLAFESLVPDGHRIALSGTGVVRTIGSEPLAIDETFAEPPEGRTIVETRVLSGYEYALGESQDDAAFRAWCEAKGIDYQTALASPGGFFSFATDQDRIVDPGGIDDSKVKIEEVKVNGGEVTLTVGIDGVPVGENAQAEYLEKVFGVMGSETLADFAADKVKYGNMQNNGDGTVSYTAEPNVEPKPDAFFFKATVVK